MAKTPKSASAVLLGIGALSKATGIPEATLRTWERRYGHPGAERLPSGHRRYPVAQIDHLNRVKQLLARGHRPGDILGLPQAQLEALLPRASGNGDGEVVDTGRWLTLVKEFRAAELQQAFRLTWQSVGAEDFVLEYAQPFLHDLGRSWACGDLLVAQEHLASEILQDIVQRNWRRISDGATGPAIVLAALPGELHTLGLHLAATLLAMQNYRLLVLGANTPVADMAKALEWSRARALLIGSSSAAEPDAVQQALAEIARLVPRDCVVLCGGAPVALPSRIMPVARLNDLREVASHQLGGQKTI